MGSTYASKADMRTAQPDKATECLAKDIACCACAWRDTCNMRVLYILYLVGNVMLPPIGMCTVLVSIKHTWHPCVSCALHKSCYLPCVWLEHGLKHWLQCTASKTTLFPFKALNQVKTFERLTTMAPPAVSMRTTNSFSRKCHAASFTILLSVKEVEPFPTNPYDTDNNLKLADWWDDWFRDTLMACETCNKSRFVDLPSSLLTLATAMWCGGIDHTS